MRDEGEIAGIVPAAPSVGRLVSPIKVISSAMPFHAFRISLLVQIRPARGQSGKAIGREVLDEYMCLTSCLVVLWIGRWRLCSNVQQMGKQREMSNAQ